MKAKIHDLAHWKRFCDTCRKEKELFCSGKTLSTFNRFYARYRLATHFEAIQVRGYSKRTLRGYSAGMRLLLAYNAAELLGTAIKNNINQWEITDPKLAAVLRKILGRPLKRPKVIFSKVALRKKLTLFKKGDNNVRVPATALRVMVAHGSFTPTGTDSLTANRATALQRLSDVLLKECEQRFGAWIEKKLAH